MNGRSYRSIILEESVYENLKELKEIYELHEKRTISFGRFIEEHIDRKLLLLALNDDLVSYINAAARVIGEDERVLAVVLFGSVARGKAGKYSDIDLLIIADVSSRLDFMDDVRTRLKSVEYVREKLVRKDLNMYISPFVLNRDDLKEFSPIYLDILDYGIQLYQRDSTLDDFFHSLRGIRHERVNVNGSEMLSWRR